MHKEKVKYYDKDGKLQECEVDSFDTVVHLTKGINHALKDIDRLLNEDTKYTTPSEGKLNEIYPPGIKRLRDRRVN